MPFSELPTVETDLSCKDGNTPVDSEVAVDVQNGSEWVRIPVVRSDVWVDRDGPADITRTAKVTFPAEWGGVSITQFVDAFTREDVRGEGEITYDQARVWHDEGSDGWTCVHYGFLGGVGPAEDTGVMKLWVYDVSDFLRGIQVSKSWSNPTIREVLRFVVDGSDDRGEPVGVTERTTFSDIPLVVISAAGQYVNNSGDDVSDGFGPLQLLRNGENVTLDEQVVETKSTTQATLGSGPLVGGAPVVFNTGGLDVPVPRLDRSPSQKSFSANRNNLIDVINWVVKEAGGKWHFEPTPLGPILVADLSLDTDTGGVFDNLAHRRFIDRNVDVEQSPLFNVNIDEFKDVSTLNNNAVVDIKPINSVELLGATTNNPNPNATVDLDDGKEDVVEVEARTGTFSQEQTLEEPNVDAATSAPDGSVYPYVKVTSPRLLERANGFEYGPKPVESDTTELSQAIRKAVDEYRQHIAGAAEGTVTLRGEPHILPYDYVTTVTVCDGLFPNADAPPITYEVESVHHRREAGVPYETELDVALTFDENNLDITATYKEA